MGSLGFGEIAFLVILALLIFGPDKLPGMASNIGRTVGALRREASSTIDELKRAAELDELRGVADDLRGAGNELRNTGAELRGAFAPGAAAASQRPAATPAGPPPFDPDAT